MNPIRVCFVCLGNICRSPTAEAVFLDRLERAGLRDAFVVDSAGTSAHHVGEQAHPDSRAEAERRGIHVPSISRQFVAGDFDRFDWVVAMDTSNQRNLERLAPDAASRKKIVLFRDYDPNTPDGTSVPDPYYEGGFDKVYDICEAAADGLLASLQSS
ncbi:MAG: low molecular weight protein-tyrosine-phosphatase [Sandaracinaceae bacterium]